MEEMLSHLSFIDDIMFPRRKECSFSPTAEKNLGSTVQKKTSKRGKKKASKSAYTSRAGKSIVK